MRLLFAFALTLAACANQMEPGETRCTSVPIGNVYATKCKTEPQRPVYAPMPMTTPMQPPPPPMPPRPIIEGRDRLYCVTMIGNAGVGSCYTSMERCERFRANVIASPTRTFDLDECAPALNAACFNFTWVLSGERDVSCSPTVADCEGRLRQFKANVDYSVTAQQCGIYRVMRE